MNKLRQGYIEILRLSNIAKISISAEFIHGNSEQHFVMRDLFYDLHSNENSLS